MFFTHWKYLALTTTHAFRSHSCPSHALIGNYMVKQHSIDCACTHTANQFLKRIFSARDRRGEGEWMSEKVDCTNKKEIPENTSKKEWICKKRTKRTHAESMKRKSFFLNFCWFPYNSTISTHKDTHLHNVHLLKYFLVFSVCYR